MLPSNRHRNDRCELPGIAASPAYQWLVLALASAGWVFDVYEGQIFNLTARHVAHRATRRCRTTIRQSRTTGTCCWGFFWSAALSAASFSACSPIAGAAGRC